MMEAFFIYKNCLWEAFVIISEVVGISMQGISMQKQLMFGCLACARLSLYGTEIESPTPPIQRYYSRRQQEQGSL